MRIDRFTQKMQEALQAAQEISARAQQPEIGNESFLLALLDQTEGVTRPLLEKLGVEPAALRSRLEADLVRRPKVQGGRDEMEREVRPVSRDQSMLPHRICEACAPKILEVSVLCSRPRPRDRREAMQ